MSILQVYELGNEKLSITIVNINDQQGEVNRLNEMLTNWLHKKEAYCQRIQVEVVSLRQELEAENKSNINICKEIVGYWQQ